MKVRFQYAPPYPAARFRARFQLRYVEFCCERMEAVVTETRAIQFGAPILTDRKECELAIYYWSCWPEGPALTRLPLDFCPFCGEPIELEEITIG